LNHQKISDLLGLLKGYKALEWSRKFRPRCAENEEVLPRLQNMFGKNLQRGFQLIEIRLGLQGNNSFSKCHYIKTQ
jgi:hypothetical protein